MSHSSYALIRRFFMACMQSAYVRCGLNIPAIALKRQTADGCRGGRSHLDIEAEREEYCSEAMTRAMQRSICSS
ncbi:hypothetical protein EVAR_8437_1 [Eumeta japonica]|uniref:Uncharacterized protein n=1 Tax=Eumeta variegata TaxID=151549 RepID=A0A4C1WEH2_EUMVA|nr:hypothetical protein EVAR_8437_1 [Eumeta japonica]